MPLPIQAEIPYNDTDGPAREAWGRERKISSFATNVMI
jgi:hypothetical protein